MEKDNSLKILILTIVDYLKEILRKWYWYALFGLLFGGLFYYQYKKQPTEFIANASLMTGGNSGGGLSSILQLAGQFGLSKPQAVTSETLVEILSSEKIIFMTLMEKGIVDGEEDYLINHYLNFYKLDEESPREGIEGFRIVGDSLGFESTAASLESILFKMVHNDITRYRLSAGATKNGIVNVSFISESEEIAKWFVDRCINVLKDYYQEKTVVQEEETLELILGRLDSVKVAMQSADYALEAWYKKNQNNLRTGTVSPKEYMNKMKLERAATISSETYVEALKNKEIAQMNYESQRPMIQIIDSPIFPLSKRFPNLLKYIFYTILMTLGPVTILIVFNKLVRDALKS